MSPPSSGSLDVMDTSDTVGAGSRSSATRIVATIGHSLPFGGQSESGESVTDSVGGVTSTATPTSHTLAADVSAAMTTSPSGRIDRLATHGSGDAPRPEHGATINPLRRTPIMPSGVPAGIADASMRNVSDSG